MRVLVCYAAGPEGELVSRQRPDESLCMGVGKVEAAMNLTRALERRADAMPDVLLLFGVCGAYPAEHGALEPVSVGELCVVGSERLVDDGVVTPSGFSSLEALGLGNTGPFAADPGTSHSLSHRLGVRVVAGGTVSRCSGTDEASRDIVARHGVQVESMEGAAVARVCHEYELPFVQLRCVSNPTGDRDMELWDLEGACHRVQGAVLELMRGMFCDA